ncbi:hypothetical protein [uncultured Enterobacter sp.]|uniref:hypothetical protein n=1 Tax=uncultured Enterobacter sp. TaxID=238202 RepID=UPI0025962E71|nr:hypothetical protein [uncultured Enterobacter sp.]
MSTITKERIANLLKFNSEGSDCQANAEQWEVHELARIALASLEAEAVCVIDQSNLDYLKSGSDADVWPASRTEMGDVLLYRAVPQPLASVPDEVSWEDVPEEITEEDMALASAWAHGFNQCRAAMLQGADGNSPVIEKAYDIEAFGVFSATEGENGLMLQIGRFRFGTGKCPQIGKENMVPKFALQAIINRLQNHCDSMGNETLVNILSTPAAPQQEAE